MRYIFFFIHTVCCTNFAKVNAEQAISCATPLNRWEYSPSKI